MQPLLDLVNHRPARKQYKGQQFDAIRVQYEPYPASIMYADQDYEPGMEITWTYGDKSNMQLLYGYGFMLDKNLDEVVYIDVVFNDRFPDSSCTGIKKQNECIFPLHSYKVSDQLLHVIRAGISENT